MNRRNFIGNSILGAAALGTWPASVFSAAPGKKPADQGPALAPITNGYRAKLDRSVRLVRELMEQTGAAAQDLMYCGRDWPFARNVRHYLAPTASLRANFTSTFEPCWLLVCQRFDSRQRLMGPGTIDAWFNGAWERDLVERYNESRLACESQTDIHRVSSSMTRYFAVQQYELLKHRNNILDDADVFERALFEMAPLPAVKIAIYDADEKNPHLEEAAFRHLFKNAGTMAIYKSYPIPGDPDFMSGYVGRPR